MSEHDAAQDLVLAQFLDLGFDHHHRVVGAGDHEIEAVGLVLDLVESRVEHVLAADIAHARRADRAHEGNAGKRQGGGRRDHGDDVRIILQIMREHGHHDLRLVLESLDEQGPDGAVDEARDQGLFFRRSALALEEAAGDLSRSERLLLVVDRQGEEVEAGLGGLVEHDRGENGGVAIGGEDGAVGLAGDAARLEGEAAAAPVDGLAFDFEHDFQISFVRGPLRADSLRGRTGGDGRLGRKVAETSPCATGGSSSRGALDRMIATSRDRDTRR
jgi:hypothetical protein